MPATHDQIANLDAELDALVSPSTVDLYLQVSKDYDPDIVAASAARRALGGGAGTGGWPVRDLIYGYAAPKAQSNFDNLSVDTVVAPWGVRTSDNTDGAWIEWYTALAAGMYTIAIRPYPYDASGILSFSLNGTAITGAPYNASAATVDTYSASPGPGVPERVIASDLTIPAAAVYALRATVTGKNASSSGYATNIVYVTLQMTAAA